MKNPKKLTSKKESVRTQLLHFLAVYGVLAGILVATQAISHNLPMPHVSDTASRMIFAIVCSACLLLAMPFIVRMSEYRTTKEKLEEMEENQSNAYTDDVIKLSQQAVEMPVALPVAWDCLKEATNGLDIKALDKRRAAWLVDSVDDDRRTVKCSLQYFADPLGRKLSQIYPRTIEMIASVDGHGVNTKLRTRYTFATPMDLEAVSEIISKTNLRLNEMIVTADRSVKEQRVEVSRHASDCNSSVAQLEKPAELNLAELGKINLPISLN